MKSRVVRVLRFVHENAIAAMAALEEVVAVMSTQPRGPDVVLVPDSFCSIVLGDFLPVRWQDALRGTPMHVRPSQDQMPAWRIA